MALSGAPNETQHGNRVYFEITQSLNQTFGRSIDCHHALNDFFGLQSSDEGVHAGQSLFQHIWRFEQSAFDEILGNSPRSKSSAKLIIAILHPAAFTKIQVEDSNVVDGSESWPYHQFSTDERPQ